MKLKLLTAGLLVFVASALASEPCFGNPPGILKGSPIGATISSVKLSADGKTLAIGVANGSSSGLFAFELPTGNLLWAHRDGSAPASIDISSDGDKVAVAYRLLGNETQDCPHVEIFKSKDGTRAIKLEDPIRSGAQSVAFSHDDRLLATAVEWTLNIWNTGGGVRFSSLEMPSYLGKSVDYAFGLVFSPDDSLLAVSDPDSSSVYIWKVSDSKIIRKFRISPQENVDGQILFSGNGKFIAVGSTGPAKVFTLAPAPRPSAARVCEIPKPASGELEPVAFTPDHDLWVRSPSGLDKWSAQLASSRRGWCKAKSLSIRSSS